MLQFGLLVAKFALAGVGSDTEYKATHHAEAANCAHCEDALVHPVGELVCSCATADCTWMRYRRVSLDEVG